MNSRVSWSVDGIDPSVRERAEAAARRAGMSLNDWLNSTVGEPSPPDYRTGYEQRPAMPSRESREVADIHQRLDAITQQIEQIAKPMSRAEAVRAEVPRGQPAIARQLNDAISRLDARLSQISKPQAARAPQQAQPQPLPMREPPMPDRQQQMQDRLQQESLQQERPQQDRQQQERQRQADAVERAAAQVYRASPPLSPASFDSAIAEIAARQNELDGPAPRQMPPRNAPPMAPAAAPMPAYAPPPPQPVAPSAPAGPDFSSLEKHLLKITSQIEALQRPDHIEQSIAAFRSELSDIRQAITEAMPRRAIESIENEVRALHRRIDEIRQEGSNSNGQVITGIERALSEIREALRTLTPAEQLTGYDEAIRNLGAKLDMILRANDDPSTVHQLEGAISALRAIVSNVASNDALLRLSEDVHALASKVDQLSQMSQMPRSDIHGEAFASIEQRIAALTSTLERERPAGVDNSDAIDNAVRALSERIDRLQVGNDSASAFTHLEQRVSYLLERLEATDQRSGNLGRVEEGLHDIMRHLEAQHAHIASLADATRNINVGSPQPMMDSGIVDMVKRELSDIRFSQSETDRRTQDSLETVHNTLGHVVDRLAMIETDLRTVRTAPPAPAPVEARMEMPRAAMPQPIAQPRADTYRPDSYRPELPNPAQAQEHFTAAPREFHAAQPVEAAPPPLPPTPPRAISEILEPHAASARPALALELPPDHPLEPGTRPTGRMSSPSERIAASESAISDLPAAKKEPVSTSSFIAAARRAAQAAAAQPVNEKAARAASKAAAKAKEKAAKAPAVKAGAAPDAPSSTITSKIRSLLVGASVVVILLGTAKMAMNLLDIGTAPQIPAAESSEPAATPAQPPAENSGAPAQAAPSSAPGPSMTSPTPLGRQSNNTPAPNTLDAAQVAIPSAPVPAAAATPVSANDVTGSIPATAPPLAGAKLAMIQIPTGEKLPDAIGGPALRSAAVKGDPTAAYEVGVRFAEGKGVAANLDEAAKWYSRAAQAGVVPAMFRLGTFYEKGLSVKRDFDVARRFYVQAAERGNAKAMHNLAVLDADGGGKGADYKSASQWFRKAADRGVADSQVNLGILYARGIGVEQNLAESFKWFSLAAAQGDADAGHKRDDIAKRLDPQSLAAAKLAIQTFTAEPQPSDAVNVATPPGGWDAAPTQAQPAAVKPAKPASKRTAALVAH
ncbi:SEL1-like repeat protein [Bradyrhizobium genosp. L]|uniref:tetratricopeptide repeat protein n=1 Tax=Bradyrhizobium genosp. L TaxID=83637 RepID=UPI0018A32A2D|nr:tetratricopeptide repeat protein [Bradyrhizobium genosp. L]QPF84479.1 SEL1-like repeat protein [Bradyrhizobium genosp. L]